MIHKHLECEFLVHRDSEALEEVKTLSITYPPKKEIKGVRSGDLGGQNVGHLVISFTNGSSEAVKERVYIPHLPMPQNLHEYKIHIQDMCESVYMQMLSSVWNETDYRFDMRRITVNGAHI
jgi:hypothetical protein